MIGKRDGPLKGNRGELLSELLSRKRYTLAITLMLNPEKWKKKFYCPGGVSALKKFVKSLKRPTKSRRKRNQTRDGNIVGSRGTIPGWEGVWSLIKEYEGGKECHCVN